MTTAEIQAVIFEQTGLKTSVRTNKGSMKHHYTFTPMFQGGQRPYFPFEFTREIKTMFKSYGHGVYCSTTSIDIPVMNFTENNPIQYKKERKPKPISEMKVKQWGSKNSQLRLDRTTARNAVKLKAGTTARYY